VKSGSRGVQQNLFYNFWIFLQVSTNFGHLKQFLEFKTNENELKHRIVLSLKSVHGLRPAGENGPLAWHGGLLCTAKNGPARPGGRPVERVAHAGHHHRAARVPGAVRWRVGRWDHRWMGRDEVLGSKTTTKRRLRRAKRVEVGLSRRSGGGKCPTWWRPLGGPVAGGEGEGGRLWARRRSGMKSKARGKNFSRRHRPFKRGRWEATEGGGGRGVG
jgi:hypothetical protein